MANKKAKDLDGLIRLNGWVVDERRRELGVLQAREDALLARKGALARQMLAEPATTANVVTQPSMPPSTASPR